MCEQAQKKRGRLKPSARLLTTPPPRRGLGEARRPPHVQSILAGGAQYQILICRSNHNTEKRKRQQPDQFNCTIDADGCPMIQGRPDGKCGEAERSPEACPGAAINWKLCIPLTCLPF